MYVKPPLYHYVVALMWGGASRDTSARRSQLHNMLKQKLHTNVASFHQLPTDDLTACSPFKSMHMGFVKNFRQ